MKLISLIFFLSSFGAFGQLRYYGTKDYAKHLKDSGITEKKNSTEQKEIKKPISLSLAFILLSKGVTKEQLSKQISILNEDFSNSTFEKAVNKNPYYKRLATDTEIRFCDNFEHIEGYTDQKIDFSIAIEYAKKYKTVTKKSILIFICDFEQLAGFAQPTGFSNETDAIFIDKDYLFGYEKKGFNLGKTLTHLIGTYLGLGELWDCMDDGITDTPLMAAEHFEQEGGWSSCYRYVVETMPQNFMYNTQDKYLNMFTIGQKQRMLYVLSTEKSYLLESSSCK